MARSTVRLVAELLIGVERCLKLAERPNSIISLQEIEEAGIRWASRKPGPPFRLRPELSRQRFIREAARWLAFMERLQPPSKSTKSYENRILEFAGFMLHERGLSVTMPNDNLISLRRTPKAAHCSVAMSVRAARSGTAKRVQEHKQMIPWSVSARHPTVQRGEFSLHPQV